MITEKSIVAEINERYAKEHFANDGITHINADTTGTTALGRMLDNIARSHFTHPVLGKFYSVEAFWIFIRTQEIHDEVRFLYGRSACSTRNAFPTDRVDNIWELMEEAVYYKVCQKRFLQQEMLASTLPFDNYYTTESKGSMTLVRRPTSAQMCAIFENVRTMIKAGREPKGCDYSMLLNRNIAG